MPTDLRLSLKALRAFASVVEHGSISAAAQALNTAPSAIAALVGQVEAEFGARLLIRTRARGIAATAEGRAMADRFRALLDSYAETLAAGRDMATSLNGTLRIGYYAPVAPAFLPRLLDPMMRDNPGLRVDLYEHDNDSVQSALLSGHLDVIVFAGQDVRAGIETSPLLTLPPYLLVPEAHHLAGTGHVSLAKAARYPLIQLDRPLARPYTEGLFAAKGLRPDIVARASSTEMVRSLVGAGVGVAVLNMQPLTRQSYGGDGLCAVPLEPGLPPIELVAGQALGAPRRLIEVFLRHLTEWMRGPGADAVAVRPG